MRLETKKYLYDLKRAIGLLNEFTSGKEFDDYTQNPLLRAAVEREFEVIGEALARLVKLEPEIGSKISEHRRIIAFRNILIHGYADVDDRLVWDILRTKLPLLSKEIDSLLSSG